MAGADGRNLSPETAARHDRAQADAAPVQGDAATCAALGAQASAGAGPPIRVEAAAAPDSHDAVTAAAQGRTVRYRRRHLLRGIAAVFVFIATVPAVLLALALAGLSASERPIAAPGWLVARIEARANAALGGAARLGIGHMEISFQGAAVPRVRLIDVAIAEPLGRPIAHLPAVGIRLDRRALLAGRIAPESLLLDGASLALRRTEEGALDLALGGVEAFGARPENAGEAIEAVKAVFATPLLSGLRRIEAAQLGIRLADARLGRVWEVREGRLLFTQDAERLALAVDFGVGAAGGPVAEVGLAVVTRQDGPRTRLAARVRDLPAADLAIQSPALAWAALLDAPVSGEISTAIGDDGLMGPMDALLEIGPGALSPVPGATPVAFESGHIRLAYDPAGDEVTIPEIRVESRALRLAASARLHLRDMAGVLPGAILAQLRIEALSIDPEGLFETPVDFADGAADLRIAFDPVRIDVGQLQLVDAEGRRLSARGGVGAGPEGWRVSLDFSAARIARARMMALWPLGLLARTRDWVATNIATGELSQVRGALRMEPGAEPVLALNYTFEGAEVQILRSLPPVLEAAGYAVIAEDRHTIVLEQGHVVAAPAEVPDTSTPESGMPGTGTTEAEMPDTATSDTVGPDVAGPDPDGTHPQDGAVLPDVSEVPVPDAASAILEISRPGDAVEAGPAARDVDAPVIDVAGSVLVVPDIRQRPPPAEVRLQGEGPIAGMLALLDRPPFSLLTKANVPLDIAEGHAVAETHLSLLLVPRQAVEDVDYRVEAWLSDLRSMRAVPGHLLESDALHLSADRAGMEISGVGTLSGVPFEGRWRRAFGPGEVARVEGRAEVGVEDLAALGIELPAGSLSGRTRVDVTLELARDAATRYRVESDLVGLGLALPEIGWRKAAGTAGRLVVTGSIPQGEGAQPAVEALELSAPGLDAAGTLALAPEGGLGRLTLSRLRIGGWFSGSAEVSGRGRGMTPDVAITSGRLDLAAAPFGQGGGSQGGGAGGAGAITVALERLVVSPGTELHAFHGRFTRRAGLSGTFTARLNGTAVIGGTIAPGPDGRSAVRIGARDAGAVIAAAGISRNAQGGALDLLLTPEGPAGTYRGRLTAVDLRIRDAPLLAAMLSAVSGVGLLEQLSGAGLFFSALDASFVLTPEALRLTSAAATGPSLGVTLAGLYIPGPAPGTGRIDMEGVVSPFYFINSIGELLTRRGEGVFGFSYSLRGNARAPQISVNPVSILTPGALRDIFRRRPQDAVIAPAPAAE